ncbi:MAG: proton-conducting transporter membrane subunit, partial [Phycisphaeraceae bacterium]|nr:proton-conducting transporter membrane subunit [Phycisphaeraceae bacterium]
AAIQVHGDEAQTYDDLSGLARKRPGLAAIMLLAVLSLIGLPPMVGFLGKIYLFGTAINHGFIGLVVIAVLNSAIAAVYYLRIVAACFFGEANDEAMVTPSTLRTVSAAVAVVLALIMGVAGDRLVSAAAGTQRPSRAQTEHPDSPPANTRASSNR